MRRKLFSALGIFALAGLASACDRTWDLPGGGSFTISSTQPVNTPADASNAQACIGYDEQGRAGMVARSRCPAGSGGVMRRQ